MKTLAALSAALAAGKTTSRQLVEECLARIMDPAGEGPRAFIKVHAAGARASADAIDLLRKAGRAPGPLAGIPFGVKDLADIAGEPTPAGSTVLADAKPAAANAPVIQRAVDAGLVIMGRTNMTEFAFSGLGINPHYGTPKSPWDRATGRIPGGSSSGTGVAVADGMVFAGLGTDTGGSCRIPAAMNGVVGYKPTARRVPIAGILPLSTSLDSVGPLANSVACCAAVDAVFAGIALPALRAIPIAGLRLAVPTNFMFDGMDDIVAAAFERSVAALSAAGAIIVRRAFPVLADIPRANALGGLAAPEAWAWHRALIGEKAVGYDPRVLIRIRGGENMLAADYIDCLNARTDIGARMNVDTADYDALMMPTCPLIPPAIAALDDEAEYARVNMLQLRNNAVGNFLDRCAISIPCHRKGDAPVGLMLMGETMGDAHLFRVAASVEAALVRG
jgi:aspartyl-tRNA(Asn)/glutamyl-tRNA(Gln) amidotransferase subunit A